MGFIVLCFTVRFELCTVGRSIGCERAQNTCGAVLKTLGGAKRPKSGKTAMRQAIESSRDGYAPKSIRWSYSIRVSLILKL
jgi:hypothetical protein